MATKSDALTSEDIIIELKTNFAEELPRMLTQYTGFITKAGTISRSLETAVMDMSKTVSKSVHNMFAGSAKEVANSMQQIRGLASQVATQGININKLHVDTVEKLNKSYQNFREEIKQTEKAIASLRKTERLNTTPVNQKKAAGERATELQAKKKELEVQMEAEALKIVDTFNKKIGLMAARASSGFVKTAELSLSNVKKTVADLNNELKKVESQMGLKTDMGKMFGLESSFKKIEQQHKANQDALKNQLNLEANNEKQMLNAKFALETALTEKTQQLHQRVFAQTVKNNEQIKRKIRESNAELEKSGGLLTDVREKLKSIVASIHKDIKQGLKSIKIAPDMDFEKNIQKLQEFRSQAMQLQKTKFVDARSDIERIDTLIKKVKEFQQQQKQLVSDQKNTKVGADAAKASKTLVDNLKTNIQSVKTNINDTIKQMDVLMGQMKQPIDLSKMFDMKNVLQDLVSKHKVSQEALKNQVRDRINSEKKMEQAKDAYKSSVTEKTKKQNYDLYQQTIRNHVAIIKGYREIGSEVSKTGQLLEGTKNKLKEMANVLHSTLKQDMSTLAEVKNQQNVGVALEKNIQKLKELRVQAVYLQKTGFVDTKSDLVKIDTLINKFKELQHQQKQMISDQKNMKIGMDSVKTSKEFADNLKANLQSVKTTISGINKQLDSVGKNLGSQDSMSQILMLNKAFKDVQAQHGQLQQSLRNQSKTTLDSQKNMLKAKEAFSTTVNEKIRKHNHDLYREAIRNHVAVIQSHKAIENSVQGMGKTVDVVKGKLNKMATEMHSAIKQGIKPSEIVEQMKKMFSSLVNEAKNSGKNMGDALSVSREQSKQVENSLSSTIQKLKEMKAQAQLLKQTGLVDPKIEIAKIDTILRKYQSFYSEFKKQQSMIRDILGQQKGMRLDMGTAELNKVRQIYNALSQEVQKYKSITSANYAEAHDKTKKLETLLNQYLAKEKQVNSHIKTLKAEMHRVEIAMAKTKNDQLLAALDSYLNKLKAKMNGVKAVMEQSVASPKIVDNTFAKIKTVAANTQNEIKRSFASNVNYYKDTFNVIKGEFNDISNRTDKLYKKRFISDDAINKMKKAFSEAVLKAKDYEGQLEQLKRALRQLEELQRRGLAGKGIQSQIEQMRGFTSQMKTHIASINAEARKTQTAVEGLHKKSLKSVLRNTWEMVRNFRWQVAAVIYLITQTANAVKRVFFNIIDEAMQFKKNVFSIAASVSYQLMGDLETTYKKAVKFSEQLMVQLELEAARTILTIEDMMMLTKTFAQAGIIPDTVEDVKKISTIGVAIRALTEGMANEGVQMRQELYSIIQGRQRAVDQLAMMFSMLGRDIQKEIKEGKAAGKDMIDVLAGALDRFAQMAKNMETSYETAKNELNTYWKMIKRIAAEPVMNLLAEEIRKINALLYDSEKKMLTAFGEDIVVTLRAALLLLYQTSKSVFGILKSIFSIIGEIALVYNQIGITLGLWKNGLNNTNSALAGIVAMTKSFLWVLNTVERVISNISTIFKAVLSTLRYVLFGTNDLIGAAWNLLKGNFKQAQWHVDNSTKLLDGMKDSWKGVYNIVNDNKKKAEELKAVYDLIDNSVNNISSEFDGIEQKWKLPHNLMNEMENAYKLQQKINQLKKASLEGPAKFKLEYELEIEEHADLEKKLKENRDARKEQIKNFGKEATKEELEQFHGEIEGWNRVLDDIEKVRKAAYNKMLKQNADYYSKAGKQAASHHKEIESFLIQTREKPETRLDKVKVWYAQTEEKIKEMIATSKEAASRAGELWKALEEGHSNRLGIAIRENQADYEAFIEKITSHEVLNQFESIDNEMNKINLAIQDSINLGEEEVKILKEKVEVAREQRKEIERTALVYQNQMKKLDLLSQKANYMQGSYSPLKQMEGDILSLYASYQKELAEIDRQIEKIVEEFKKPEGMWKEHSKEMQEYYELLREQYRLTTEAFERDVWKKQNPMWNDLIEMSKSWSDSITDSLTDLVLDFENFGESIKKVWESIVKDTLRIIIQRKMMEPLMDALGSGEPGSETLYQKMTGKEAVGIVSNLFGQMADKGSKTIDDTNLFNKILNKEDNVSFMDQMLKSNRPIPVYIVDAPIYKEVLSEIGASTEAIKISGEKTTEAIFDANKESTNKFTDWFKRLFEMIGKIVTALVAPVKDIMEGVMGWVKSAIGMISSWGGGGGGVAGIAGVLANLFGGGGGMNIGAPIHVGAGGTTAFGMAEGGTISEHIVGKGLSSGKIYEFGEKSKYGEFEDVVPRKKMHRQKSGQSVTMSMPININAIDTQTGVDFILKNQKLIEANMLRSMKNNKAIRGMIRQSW